MIELIWELTLSTTIIISSTISPLLLHGPIYNIPLSTPTRIIPLSTPTRIIFESSFNSPVLILEQSNKSFFYLPIIVK